MLAGNIASGEIEVGMVLICEDKKVRMQFDAIEYIVSKLAGIGLAFYNKSEQDIAQLEALSPDDIICIQKPDSY